MTVDTPQPLYDMGYIILQYGQLDYTLQCIQSIRANTPPATYQIVVVDNCSPDDAYQKICQLTQEDSDVTVLKTLGNIGFARGNNLGYDFLRKKCRFICILNSDVELLEPGFVQQVEATYREHPFGVMGPYIHLPAIKRAEWLMSDIGTWKQEKKRLAVKRRNAWIAYLGLNELRYRLGRIVHKHESPESKDYEEFKNEEARQFHKNRVLNGCCLIFSSDYLQKMEHAFDPRTFFYGEEQLLYVMVRQAGMDTVYQPSIRVNHYRFVSTDAAMKGHRKICFQWKNSVFAQKLLVQKLAEMQRHKE